MRLYYYFLFRLYWTFRDLSKESHKMALISTSLLSVFFFGFTLYALMGAIQFFRDSTMFDFGENYKFWILSFAFMLWFINYTFFIKPRNFLRQGFKKDRLGGFVVILVILLIGTLFLIGANKNREKIFSERQKNRIENNF